MSHQTGIQANTDLKTLFGKCADGKIRVLKIIIENEELCLAKQCPTNGTWEEDFDKYVPLLVVDHQPCFILYRFYEKFKIPGVLGCIDGTHVAIIRPQVHEERYYNRKGYHSLNVMIICDSDLNILCVDPSTPGSAHDSGIWQRHPLCSHMAQLSEAGEQVFLLGDSGYPLRNTMMTPILNTNKGTPENYYYRQHVSARNTVERCIGVLKARFRLDTKNSLGYEWFLLSWCPDTSPIRQKMLFASTKATLKQEFGSAHIKNGMHATSKEEVNFKGYQNYISSIKSPAPLTRREEELKEMQSSGLTNNHFGTDSRQSTLSGVSFPISEEVKQGLVDLKAGRFNYLQFKIDIEEEMIHLCDIMNVPISEIHKHIPNNAARYHLLIFKHLHADEHLVSLVFVYTMPGYSCSIKERMLYSSCKGPFLDFIEKSGLEVTKKLEIGSGEELTEDFLYEELHPKRYLHRPAFDKPKGPPNRGAKRITKNQNQQ